MAVRKREWKTSKGEVKTAWVADYTDTNGKRHQIQFDKKKEADAFVDKARVEVRAGTHVADSDSVTVAKAGAFWISSGESEGLERSTINQRKSHLKNHIIPFIGSVLMSKLTVPGVRTFEDQLRQEGRSKEQTKKVITSLGSIFADANERGLANRNPVRDIRGSRKGREKRQEDRQKGKLVVGVDIPSRDEIRALIASLDDNWRPLLVTVIFTGMRSSELRGLRWQDVDFKTNEIHVRQRVDQFRQVGKTKSGAGFRTIPVPPLVITALKTLKLKQQPDAAVVFANPEGTTRSHSNVVSKGLQPAWIRAGICSPTGEVTKRGKPVMKAKYTGLHSLRHFFASWMINRKEDGGLGLPVKVVQERMGHSSITMTMDTYGHLFPRLDDGTELADAANALIS